MRIAVTPSSAALFKGPFSNYRSLTCSLPSFLLPWHPPCLPLPPSLPFPLDCRWWQTAPCGLIICKVKHSLNLRLKIEHSQEGRGVFFVPLLTYTILGVFFKVRCWFSLKSLYFCQPLKPHSLKCPHLQYSYFFFFFDVSGLWWVCVCKCFRHSGDFM